MIKKLLLTFSIMMLLATTNGVTVYAAEEEKMVVSEELANTLNVLNNLYKEGIITDDEFSSAKSMLLDPISASGKKTEKKLTAVERKRIKEAAADKLKAQKKLLKAEKLAAKDKIKQARIDEMEKACTDEYSTSDATIYCTLLKLNAIGSEALNKN